VDRFRVATYNIHKGRGLDGRVRIERIAGVLEEIGADIVALQEVISHEGLTGSDTFAPLEKPANIAAACMAMSRSAAGHSSTSAEWILRFPAGKNAGLCAPTSA